MDAKVCLVDIGSADGLRLTASITCPFLQELAALPRCQGSGEGELCIASKGECLVPKDLENCQDGYGALFSVFQKGSATTCPRTSAVKKHDAETLHLEWTAIAAVVVAALLLGGLALAILVRRLQGSQKATTAHDGTATDCHKTLST